MTIRRSATAGDRTAVLQRAALQDQRLSFRARGVLAVVLSRPPDWRTSADRLAAESPREARDAIRTALAELEQFGYLRRTNLRGPDGRWNTVWDLSDDPAEVAANLQVRDITAGRTALDEPTSVEPTSVEPSSLQVVETGGREQHPKGPSQSQDRHVSDARRARGRARRRA